MIALSETCIVQAVEGQTLQNAQSSNQFRLLVPSSTKRLAWRLSCDCATKCRPATLRKGSGVTFQSGLNRETASCHTVRRNMTGPASAGACARVRECVQTHRPAEMENVSALTGCALGVDRPMDTREQQNKLPNWNGREDSASCRSHSEHCGFLFLSHFMSDKSHMRRLGDALLFLGGEFLCFLLFLSLLIHRWTATINTNKPMKIKHTTRYNKLIKDSKQDLVIHVKPEDISGAVCRDHQKCVIARAIMRQRSSTAKWVDVGANVVLVGTGKNTGRRYFLNNQARKQVRFFDLNDGRFAPCNVSLSAPTRRKIGERTGQPPGPRVNPHRKRQVPTR